MRRRLAPIEDSPRTCTGPTWLPWPTWVPPHSSREKSPTSTTRTTVPYFSPNSEMAPAASASARLPCQTRTSGSASSWRLTAASISARRSGGTGWEGGEVERRPVQDQLDLVALAGRGQLLAVAQQPQDAGLGAGGLVADEGGAAVAAGQVPVGLQPAQVGVQLAAGLLCPAALVVHELPEAVGVDVQAGLGRRLQGQLVGEPEGVVELEGGVAGEGGRALLPGA